MWMITLTSALLLGGFTVVLARQLAERRHTLIALEKALMDYLTMEQNGRIRHAARLEQQAIVEKTVDTGAGSAELVHKTVADVTFGIMNNIEVTKEASKLVRGLHDGIADSVYTTVRTSNKEIGKLAKELLKLKGDFDAAKRRREAARTGVPGKPAAKTDDKSVEGKPGKSDGEGEDDS
jgi:hypothetical protein